MSTKSTKSRNQQVAAPREALHGAAASRWEWVSAAIGLVLVLGTVSFIGYKALTTEAVAPDVTVDHIDTVQTSGGYIVRFRVLNSGPATAAALNISGTLLDATAEIESSDVTLDYLPPHGDRQGGLIFQNDPARFELRLEAKGYVDP